MPPWMRPLREAAFLAASSWTALAGPVLPVSGELSGELLLGPEGSLPPVVWRVEVAPGSPEGRQQASWSISAPGLEGRGTVWRQAEGNFGWELDGASLDLSRWAAAAGTLLPAPLRGAEFAGTARLHGSGRWRAGQLEGRLAVALEGGRIRQVTPGWEVSGLAFEAVLAELPSPRTEGAVVVTFEEATVAGIKFTQGRLEFTAAADGSSRLANAHAAVLGGRLELDPLIWQPAQPEIRARIRVTGLQLDQLARLLPPVLSEAAGSLGGSLMFTWSAGAGIRPGPGHLQIEAATGTRLRLTPQPGFLTEKVPARLAALPAAFGPLATAFSAPNPVYGTLRALEMGEIMLDVAALEADLQPEGDSAGRTAHVRVSGFPARGEAVQAVSFELNVRGPLTDVIRLGIEKRLRVDTRAGSAR